MLKLKNLLCFKDYWTAEVTGAPQRKLLYSFLIQRQEMLLVLLPLLFYGMTNGLLSL